MIKLNESSMAGNGEEKDRVRNGDYKKGCSLHLVGCLA
jgi:hypothetical protein